MKMLPIFLQHRHLFQLQSNATATLFSSLCFLHFITPVSVIIHLTGHVQEATSASSFVQCQPGDSLLFVVVYTTNIKKDCASESGSSNRAKCLMTVKPQHVCKTPLSSPQFITRPPFKEKEICVFVGWKHVHFLHFRFSHVSVEMTSCGLAACFLQQPQSAVLTLRGGQWLCCQTLWPLNDALLNSTCVVDLKHCGNNQSNHCCSTHPQHMFLSLFILLHHYTAANYIRLYWACCMSL